MLFFTLFLAIKANAQTVNNVANTKFSNQVNIGKGGTTNVATHNSAWLEIGLDNTTKAFRISRGDTLTVVTPTYGLLHYNMVDSSLYYHNGVRWGSLKTSVSICDSLSNFPSVPYTSGMKFVTSGGGGVNIPSNYVGYDYDMTNIITGCGTNVLTTFSIVDIQHCTQSIPAVPITCNDETAVNAFINSTVIVDYNACSGQPPLVAGDVIYVYNSDNTATMWVNPAITYPSHNLVVTDGTCSEKIEPTIPTTHTITYTSGGGGCYVAELPITGADNGDTVVANKVGLGGSLIRNTFIDQKAFDLEINDTMSNNINQIHQGGNVIGLGIKGVGFTSKNISDNVQGYLFTGDASSIGGATTQASIGLTDFGTGNSQLYTSFNAGNYNLSLQASAPSYNSHIDLDANKLELHHSSGDYQISNLVQNNAIDSLVVWDGLNLRYRGISSLIIPSIDTTSLSNRIDERVKYTDTASMLANYVNNVGYGLTKTGQVISADTVSANGLATQYDILQKWDILGNAGTNPSTNFLGTTDAQDLVFRTNNLERSRITSTGFMGINTTTPAELLRIKTTDLLSTATAFSVVNTTDVPRFRIKNNGTAHFGNSNLTSGVAIAQFDLLSGDLDRVVFLNSRNQNLLMIRQDGLINAGTNDQAQFCTDLATNNASSIITGQYYHIGAPSTHDTLDNGAHGGGIQLFSRNSNATTGQMTNVYLSNRGATPTDGFNPTTGTRAYTSLSIRPNYNQTGTATGVITGIDYNPTITSITGSHYAALFRSGFVGIGTPTPTEALHVVGNILATGTITPSDERVKENIQDFEGGLNQILELKTKTYNIKNSAQLGVDSNRTEVGYVAQNFESIFGKDAVKEYDHYFSNPIKVSKNEFKTYKESEFIKEEVEEEGETVYYIKGLKNLKTVNDRYVLMSLVNAVKELKSEIDKK